MPKQSGNAPAAESEATPVADHELPDLFKHYAGFDRIALAVSDGSDSLALLHLSVRWRPALMQDQPRFLVLCVDHGLRPESSQEAQHVASAAGALGLDCRILTRPPQPAHSGIQAAARADRYRLLAEAANGFGAAAIATGHTLDDQAETVLMRLARGSGVDGLSAMAARSRLGGIALLRPLLSLTKARLRATLLSVGATWSEDPSNTNLAFERPRLRAVMPVLAEAGLTAKALARSARRLARVRTALEAAVGEAANRLVRVHKEGYLSLSRPAFNGLPEEIRLRLLGGLLAALGAPGQPQRLERLEHLVSDLAAEPAPAQSLAGCIIQVTEDTLVVIREPGRAGLPVIAMAPGDAVLWDRRFHIALASGALVSMHVRALQADDLHGETAIAARASGLSRPILLASPSVWLASVLMACPALQIQTPGIDVKLSLPNNAATLIAHSREQAE